MGNNNVIDIVKSSSCCGCGACISVCGKNALSYSKDKFGFIIPVIDKSKCINCGLCCNVCPSINQIKCTPVKAFAAVSKDNELLMNSSSGAIFGTIASYILQIGGVVYGCAMSSEGKVFHTRIDSLSNLKDITRSKYVQSDMKYVYKDIKADLNKGLIVLFSGTPCQVSAVTNFCGKHKNLRTIDIVCHGVPSQDLFDSYIEYENTHDKTFEGIVFRAKRSVRNGMNWYFGKRHVGEKKYSIHNWPEEAYTYLYMYSLVNRDSCYQCKFTTIERVGDITLCDYWKWYEYHKEFPSGSTVSGVIINTEIGQIIFNKVKYSLNCCQTQLDYISQNNSCLRYPAKESKLRFFYLDLWKRKGYQAVSSYFQEYNQKVINRSKLFMLIPQCTFNLIETFRYKLRK